MGRRDVATPSVTPMSDPVEAAQAAARATGLRYATDSRPGITRVRSGRGFSYRDPDGATITRSAGAEADRGTGHPAGLDRRLDLPVAERAHPGDRP